MYGKHFESMYEGSMYGAGVAAFAVWGYVISHARGGWVELNPVKLCHTLGGTEEEIHGAILFLSSPDPKSRCKEHEGRRLVKEGEFKYFLPSWEIYHRMRKEEDRREQNRIAQAAFREKQKSRPMKKKLLTVWDEEIQDYVKQVVDVPQYETLRQKVRREVEADPITISDKKEGRRLRAGDPPDEPEGIDP